MAPFPSPIERIVASALLLLAATPPTFCLDDDHKSARERSKIQIFNENSVSEESRNKSRSSLITTSEASTEEIRARKIRTVALAALHREMNLKAVRRSRSKTQTTWKTVPESSETASFASESTETSCLSSSSSAASSARSRHVSRSTWTWNQGHKLAMVREEPIKRKTLTFTSHMRHQTEAILRLLSGGRCFSEGKIRQTIGDSPDTSKALRVLLKLEKVKRSGLGGRHNPYIYTMA